MEVKEGKKDSKLFFLEFGKDPVPTVLVIPGNTLEILILKALKNYKA